jgi:hypothetical protein
MKLSVLSTVFAGLGFVAGAPTNATSDACFTNVGYSFISQPGVQNFFYSSVYVGDDLVCNAGKYYTPTTWVSLVTLSSIECSS